MLIGRQERNTILIAIWISRWHVHLWAKATMGGEQCCPKCDLKKYWEGLSGVLDYFFRSSYPTFLLNGDVKHNTILTSILSLPARLFRLQRSAGLPSKLLWESGDSDLSLSDSSLSLSPLYHTPVEGLYCQTQKGRDGQLLRAELLLQPSSLVTPILGVPGLPGAKFQGRRAGSRGKGQFRYWTELDQMGICNFKHSPTWP